MTGAVTVAVVQRERDRDRGRRRCATRVTMAVVLRERTVIGIYGYGRNKAELWKRPK